MIDLVVAGLSLDPVNKSPILVLCTKDNKHVLPIWIGPSEAVAISLALQDITVPRPLTHDLLLTAITSLGFTLKAIHISSVDDGVFYADLELNSSGTTQMLDCRPSDAAVLAIRAKVPIYTTVEVIEEAGFDYPDNPDGLAVPVTAGDGAIAVLAADEILSTLTDTDNDIDTDASDMLADMIPESKYKM